MLIRVIPTSQLRSRMDCPSLFHKSSCFGRGDGGEIVSPAVKCSSVHQQPSVLTLGWTPLPTSPSSTQLHLTLILSALTLLDMHMHIFLPSDMLCKIFKTITQSIPFPLSDVMLWNTSLYVSHAISLSVFTSIVFHKELSH